MNTFARLAAALMYLPDEQLEAIAPDIEKLIEEVKKHA